MSLDITIRSGRIEASSTAESAMLTVTGPRPPRVKVFCEPRAAETAYRLQVGSDSWIDIVVPEDTAQPILIQAANVHAVSFGTDPSSKALTVNPPRPPAPPSSGF